MAYLYTAIGDSLTTGFGALPGNGFVPIYRRMAEAKLKDVVINQNLGVNGLTSPELEQRVLYHPLYQQALTQADLITISIGGNDLIRAGRALQIAPDRAPQILGQSLDTCQRSFGNIVRSVQKIKAGSTSPYAIRVVGLYNPFPQIQEGSEWVRQFNAFASGFSNKNFAFADISGAFAAQGRELLFWDGVHPNGRGYRTIAGQLDKLGFKPLS
ncbi:lysophospholipase L1-like esterase [Paenibacillus shirakamiensis]|uniref:Lysophospholipase L1-like esterase n=1 Tax=Paenibacillus shirakamiensis TaxID=1265935 RepID=A0ABS4JI97_9BACL|nr:GDSL-type esterase/lipase family protein [Paenibacillus shirakamiensis]MBP2001435.1 lysophospholipase L1-like esterase [Paenibacillus shirakamiensis]